MRRFVLGWKKLGLEHSLGTRLVTYADDLVILCRRGSAEKVLHHLRAIMGKLKLTVNEEKTRICSVPDGEFDFLGYTFGRMYSPVTGKARLGYRPSKKSIKRMVERVHALTIATTHGVCAATKPRSFARVIRLRNSTCSATSAPCSWNSSFAMSKPSVNSLLHGRLHR